MARLRNAVFLELVQVRKNFVARVAKAVQNFRLRLAAVRTQKPAHILRDEPIGLKFFESRHRVTIQQAVFAVEPAPFADDGKIIAREAERQRVNISERVEIQIAHVATNHGVGRVGTNIFYVSRAR